MFRQRRIMRDYGPQPLLFLVGKQTVTRPLGIICHQVSGVVPSPEAELLRNPAPGVPLVAGKSSLGVAMLFFGCYALGFQCQCGGFLLPQLLGQLCLFLSQIETGFAVPSFQRKFSSMKSTPKTSTRPFRASSAPALLMTVPSVSSTSNVPPSGSPSRRAPAPRLPNTRARVVFPEPLNP